MIDKPTATELEALSILENNPNFVLVKEWLNRSLGHTYARLAESDCEVTTRRAQGSAQDLTEILTLAADARNLIEKSRR